MGLKDLTKRFTQSIGDLDKARLQSRYCGVDVTSIADAPLREPVRLVGEVAAMQVVPRAGSPSLEVVLVDDTGGISVVFLSRRKVGGIRPGTVMTVEGVVGAHERRLAILNPTYELESVPGM